MLAMNIQQLRTGFTQLGCGGDMTIDQRPRTPISIHYPSQQQLTGIALQLCLRQPLLQARQGLDGKLGRDLGTLGTGTHLIRIGTASQRQGQGIDQDGFSRTGLAEIGRAHV